MRRCLTIHLRLGASRRLMSGAPAQRTSMSYTSAMASESVRRAAMATCLTPVICSSAGDEMVVILWQLSSGEGPVCVDHMARLRAGSERQQQQVCQRNACWGTVVAWSGATAGRVSLPSGFAAAGLRPRALNNMIFASRPRGLSRSVGHRCTCMGVAPKEKDSKLAPSTAVGEEARSSGSISALSSAPSARSKAGHRTCSASLRNLRAQPIGNQGGPLLC